MVTCNLVGSVKGKKKLSTKSHKNTPSSMVIFSLTGYNIAFITHFPDGPFTYQLGIVQGFLQTSDELLCICAFAPIMISTCSLPYTLKWQKLALVMAHCPRQSQYNAGSNVCPWKTWQKEAYAVPGSTTTQ